MKLSKFLLTIFMVTGCAIIYISQQNQILLTGYQMQRNQIMTAYLLDCQEKLLYNVAQLKSPQCIEKRLAMRDINMQRTGKDRVIKIVKAGSSPKVMAQKSGRRFLGLSASRVEAQEKSHK